MSKKMQKKSMKRRRNRKVDLKDDYPSTTSTDKHKNKSNKKRSSKPKISKGKKRKQNKSKKSIPSKQKYKYRKQGQKPSSYPEPYTTGIHRKLSESDDMNTKSAKPFNPMLIEQQGYVYNNNNNIQYDEKEIEKDTYPIEGVSDLQILLNSTTNGLPIKPLPIDSDSDDSNSNNNGTYETNDIIASSEDSVSIKDENENKNDSDNELINNGAVTMLGGDINEKIKFNENISMGNDINEQIKCKDNIVENNNEIDSDIIAPNQSVTMIGSDINEKVKFKSDIIMQNNNSNDIIAANPGNLTMIGSVNDNEKVMFKEYNKDNNRDIDGDIIRNMNDINNTETIMGMDINDKISFNNNNTEDNKHESDDDDVLIGNNETLIGAINEKEKVLFNDNKNEYNNEGKFEKNSVLTDLQNIKNNVINALPDPNISYDNPLHPIHNKKNLYNYADDLSTMYDKSFALKRSMDNTYNKDKNKKKIKGINDIKKKKSYNKTSNKIMTLKDLQPGAAFQPKSKSKIKSKSNGSNIRTLNHNRKSKKKSNKYTNKSKRWKAFLKRNGI